MVVTANGSCVPLTLMSTVWILAVGIAVDAAKPLAWSPAGLHVPTADSAPSIVVTTMS